MRRDTEGSAVAPQKMKLEHALPYCQRVFWGVLDTFDFIQLELDSMCWLHRQRYGKSKRGHLRLSRWHYMIRQSRTNGPLFFRCILWIFSLCLWVAIDDTEKLLGFANLNDINVADGADTWGPWSVLAATVVAAFLHGGHIPWELMLDYSLKVNRKWNSAFCYPYEYWLILR